MVSILILTLNEEANLAACMESVAWSDDVVILDSYSSDGTLQIARAAKARVVQRRFDNWSAHQNWAVREVDFRFPWVLYLDADERCDDQLKGELQDESLHQRGPAAYQVRRKDFFMGRWLRRAQIYPTWLTRVFRPGKIRYQRLVNPVAVVDGGVGQLRGHLIHYPFSHGIGHWLDRHNRYSQFEAQDLLAEIRSPNDLAGLLARDATRRRKAIKRLAYGTPGRPLLVLFYLLVIRRGLLEGCPGISYACLRSMYQYIIDLKVVELRRKQQGLSM